MISKKQLAAWKKSILRKHNKNQPCPPDCGLCVLLLLIAEVRRLQREMDKVPALIKGLHKKYSERTSSFVDSSLWKY